MAKILYNFLIYSLDFALIIASLFNTRAKKILKGRKNWAINLKSAVEKNGKEMVWFHCASLGEFEQGRPVIERIKHDFPGKKILLTFFSPSGFETRKNYELADSVLYLPSDTSRNSDLFIEILQPQVAVFVKYEFWYNFLDACRKYSITLLSISTIFRPDQIFFRPWGNYFRKRLGNYSQIFVQDENSKLLLSKIGVTNATVSGDTRFDRVYEIRKNPMKIGNVSGFCKDADVMILGSIWPSDMKLLAAMINDQSLKLKFVIAPHNISNQTISGIEESLIVTSTRFSENNPEDQRVMIIDNIGMLSSLYQYGKFAYIGGAFSEGLHNILEPAAFGLPVLFGDHPSNRKFREVEGLINSGGGFAIHDGEELRTVVGKLLTDPVLYHAAASASGTFVINNTGATDRIVTYMKKYLT